MTSPEHSSTPNPLPSSPLDEPSGNPSTSPQTELESASEFVPSRELEASEPHKLKNLDEEVIHVNDAPESLPNPISGYLAQVLEIIPDVDPEYALSLVKERRLASRDRIVEVVIQALSDDPAYPKLDKRGKRKRVEDDVQGDARGAPKPKLDYGNKNREYNGGVHYAELSLAQLIADFPQIPVPYIQRTLLDQRSLYAPTHLFLEEEQRRGGPPPYVPNAISSCATEKGKRKALFDPEFETEREWINSRAHDDTEGVQANVEDYFTADFEDGIECGCCFSTYPFDQMLQCPDAHLFCSSCMATYAETLLGSHDHNIICMDQSGCKLPFPYAELRRCLTPKLMTLYERVKQTKEIEAAGIEGLEACPFCEYKCVIENAQQKLFACRNAAGGCAAVTCRQCKRLDHLPKSCKEMEEDKSLDGRHVVEEVMTRAFKRECPKCEKAFIKVEGCNTITCPNCHARSCYNCRTLITDHTHFMKNPQCGILEDSAATVKAAANKALEEYKRAHPDIDEDKIKVDLQLAPAGRNSAEKKVRR
ncbi:hypothetical protein FB451DRAFT_1263132 [Mycena latifolia]|nr:hypothetical protein FB451DRAFT_1263132 [Mycena latifolia]